MIGSLRGTLLERNAQLLIEVAGIGYRVQTTASVASSIGSLNSEVFVHIHHAVREDSEVLYGFATSQERATFELLIDAHRVGPSLALAILEVHPPQRLREIVATDAVDEMCKVPGVGRKTAIRLLVELKSKLDLPEADAPPDSGEESTILVDVRQALTGLGYSSDEIRQAIAKLGDISVDDGSGGDVQELVRQALQYLASPRS